MCKGVYSVGTAGSNYPDQAKKKSVMNTQHSTLQRPGRANNEGEREMGKEKVGEREKEGERGREKEEERERQP